MKPVSKTAFYCAGARSLDAANQTGELGQLPWYMKLMGRLTPTLRDGYSIRVFRPRT